MSNLFAEHIPKNQPVEHFCMLCERVASHGFELRRMPARENGPALPGDGFCGYAWYCNEHKAVGAALLKRRLMRWGMDRFSRTVFWHDRRTRIRR